MDGLANPHQIHFRDLIQKQDFILLQTNTNRNPIPFL